MVGALPPGAVSDYETDLHQVERELARLEPEAAAEPTDASRHTRLVYRRYHRASLIGTPAELVLLPEMIAGAIAQGGPNEDLALLEATVALALHQWERVHPCLAALPGLLERRKALSLLADADLETGAFEHAKGVIDSLAADNPTWGELARLANLARLMGHIDEADARYADAQELLSAKEMRTFAWLEVQRGRLDLGLARYDEAGTHYRRAATAYSGYWLVEERRAELAGALRHFDEAADRYEWVLGRSPRPEIEHALGDVLTLARRAGDAQVHHDRALAGFLASAERGEVHYLHHLTAFYADVRLDGPRALHWAAADLERRPGPLARAAFAWALHRCHRPDDAAEAMDLALAPGVRTGKLLRRGAIIYGLAERAEAAAACAGLAATLDPFPDDYRAPD